VDDKITISVVGSGIFALYHHDRLMTEKNNQVSRLTAEVERLKDRLADAVAQATTPAKPVVWVMRTASANYYRVTESGNTFSESCIYERMQWWKAIYAGIAEVRVWPETCDKCGQAIASEGR